MFDILYTDTRQTTAGKKAFHHALILLQWQSWIKNKQHALHLLVLGAQVLMPSQGKIMMKKVVQ